MAENQNDLLQRVLDEVNKVHDTGRENHGEIAELKQKAAQLERDMATIEQKAAAELELVKASLKPVYGKAGAGDWVQDFGAWNRALYMATKGRESSELLTTGQKAASLVTKAEANPFDTTSTGNSTSGALIPTIFNPGIVGLLDTYGNLYPRVTKIQTPPGQALRINSQTANPVAAWRATQGGAMTPEATPQAFGYDTLTTQLCYVYQRFSNELMMNPNVNINTVFALEGIKAIVRKVEYDMLAAASSPSAGVISASNVNTQTTMASATFALMVAFLKECQVDNANAPNIVDNAIFLHPRDALTLATQAVGASELTGMLVWGDPRRGIPSTLMGYEVIVHPGCNNGSNTYAILGMPRGIYLAETGNFGIDFSDQVAFGDFETAMRVYSHFDWSITQPDQWHIAVVTA